MHSSTVRVILNICHTFKSFFLNQICNSCYKSCLVNTIRNFSYNNFKSVAAAFNYFCLGTNINFSATCCISLFNTTAAHNNSCCREVRTLNMYHQILKTCIRIINKAAHTFNNLVHIMRWNICSHTNSNT